MLGVGPDSKLPYVIPGILVLVGLAGIIWGLYLRGTQPDVYSKISRGQPRKHAVVDVQLADIEL
jgi:hypothetical protein